MSWRWAVALWAMLAGCRGGGVTAPPPAGGRDSGASGDAGAAAASHQVTEVTLRGPAAVVSATVPAGMDLVQTSSAADGTVNALFRSVAGSDWNSLFGFSLASGSSLSVRPWLCPRVPNAVSAALAGGQATEQRLLDVDGDGRFWTNGELGDQDLSICRYGAMNGSGGDEATFQDGPDLCAESSRAGTQIQILDGQQNVISQPVVCAAGFGLARTPGYAAQIRLQLEKDADDQDGMAFTAAINHCLPAGATIPTVVTSGDMLASTCPEESVWFQAGAGSPVEKPRSYPVAAGTWTVQSASPDRTADHASQIDLTFASADGSVTYRVRGVVALPQLLF